MFAVIKTGGKQYRVAANDTITTMRLAGEAGETVLFDSVLMVGGDAPSVGAPFVEGASVAGEIVEQARGPKVIAFKKRRRKDSKRRRGHRQDLTIVRITEILTGGAKPSQKPAAQAAPAPSPAPSPAPAASEGSSIAAAATAAAAAARETGIDTDKFSRLEKPIGQADDLKLINGVGPMIETKLNEIGVWHFWQVAAVAQEDIDAIEDVVGFKGRAERDEWKAQAIDLMAGKPPQKPAAEAAPAPSPAPSPAPAASEGSGIAAAATAAAAAARETGIDTDKFSRLEKPIGQADDLKLINGVGPMIETKLNEIGVWHFWQVAAVAQEDIDAIEDAVGFKGRAERDEWKAQAIDLMAGKPPRSKAHKPDESAGQ